MILSLIDEKLGMVETLVAEVSAMMLSYLNPAPPHVPPKRNTTHSEPNHASLCTSGILQADHLRSVHKRLKAVETTIVTIHQHAFRMAAQATQPSPAISCLPNEILEIIFCYTAKDEVDACALAAVCHHWRELAHELPSIWCTLEPRTMNAELINLAVHHSEGNSMLLRRSEVPLSPYSLSPRIRKRLGQKLTEAVFWVGRGQNGLGLLSLLYATEDFEGFPSLRYLTLELERKCFHCSTSYKSFDLGEWFEDQYITLTPNFLPNLQRLKLTATSGEDPEYCASMDQVMMGNSPHTSLTHLSIESLSIIDGPLLADFLRLCPNLEILDLSCKSFDIPPAPSPIVVMSLREFTFHGSSSGLDVFSSYLSAPNLRSISLRLDFSEQGGDFARYGFVTNGDP